MAHIAVLFAIRLLRRTAEYDSSPHCSNTHAAYHLCGLATKTGEKVGLAFELPSLPAFFRQDANLTVLLVNVNATIFHAGLLSSVGPKPV